MKRALITGITGQDGSYLAEFLLEKGYEVHGIKRRSSLLNTQRVDHIYQDPHVENSRFKLHYGDLSDSSNLTRVLCAIEPDEVYNLGDPSKAKAELGWEPEITAQDMCKEMVAEDHKAARRFAILKEHDLELPVSIEN